jgi:hypothetical protein
VNSRLPLAPSLLRVTIGCLSMPIRVFSRSGHVAGLVILRQTFVRRCHRWQFEASLEAKQQAQPQARRSEHFPVAAANYAREHPELLAEVLVVVA